jgi:hypothetical protein
MQQGGQQSNLFTSDLSVNKFLLLNDPRVINQTVWAAPVIRIYGLVDTSAF